MVDNIIVAPGVDDAFNEIVERIVDRYQPEKIILFGSHAYGRPDADSDLDLLIVKQTKEHPIDRRVQVRTILRSIKAGLAISPIVVTRDEIEGRLALGDQFAQEIIDRGLVLYERN